jgi:hypothetical protein
MRAVFFSFIVSCLALLNFITPASATARKVEVAIPTFAVEVNGKKIDIKHALHPPLLYKGVTYFPMTSDYAKALGLLVQWNTDLFSDDMALHASSFSLGYGMEC